jgi:ammonia channel protein AmtB
LTDTLRERRFRGPFSPSSSEGFPREKGRRHVGAAPSAYAPTVPAKAFMVFQMMFAIITPVSIAEAFAERMRFSGYLLFVGL